MLSRPERRPFCEGRLPSFFTRARARAYACLIALAGLSLPTAASAACATYRTVCAAACDYTTITAAVNAIPASPLTGDWCIDIADNGVYSEQVTVQGKNTAGYRIVIGTETAATRPAVIPPAGSTAAFRIMNSSVVIAGLQVVAYAGSTIPYGIWASSAFVTISSVSVSTVGPNGLGFSLAGIRVSSRSVVEYSSVSVSVAHGIWLDASSMTTVRYSTALVNSSSSDYAVYLLQASSNVLVGVYAFNRQGDALRLSGADYNALSGVRTFTDQTSRFSLGLVSGSSSNTVTLSVLETGPAEGYALYIAGGSDGNVVSYSTITSYDSGTRTFEIDNSHLNTVTDSLFYNPGGGVARIVNGSTRNTIAFSTLTAFGSSGALELLAGVASNTVTGSVLVSGSGSVYALTVDGDYNTVSLSSFSHNFGAIRVGGSYNLIDRVGMSAEDAFGVVLTGDFNTLRRSTVAAAGQGLRAGPGSFNTVIDCYVQGSTAAVVFNSSGATFGGNVLVSSGPAGAAGSAFLASSGNTGLTLSSNVFVAAAAGTGVSIGSGSSGLIVLSTNVVYGGRYGVRVGTQAAGTQLWLSSNTVVARLAAAADTFGVHLDGLSTGATLYGNAVVLRTAGTQGAFTAYGLYARSSSRLLVSRNRVNNPGLLGAGSYVAAHFEDVTQAQFRYNDVHATGVGLTDAFLLRLAASTVTLSGNVFLASMTVSGSSASLTADALSGWSSDYNDWFSSNTANTVVWGGAAYAWPWSGALGRDASSLSANPLWPDPSAGVEDFHPKSAYANGRYNPATGAFDLTDAASSPAIDAGEPLEAYALEPSPRGPTVNMGSYGGTAQASRSSSQAPELIGFAGVDATTAAVSFTPAYGTNQMVELSTAADFTGVLFTSVTANPVPASLVVSGLSPNTTYYGRAGSLVGVTTHYALVPGSPRSTLAKRVTAGEIYRVWSSSLTANWVPRPASPPDASSETANGYLLQASTAADFTGAVWSSATTGVAQTTLTLTGLLNPATYFVRVGALDWGGRPHFFTLGSTLTVAQVQAGCAQSVSVSRLGAGKTTISQAVAALVNPLPGHSCVVILDGATYEEQVEVRNFVNNGSSLTIMADPASGLRPVVSPPAASTAAFRIANASVNVFGLDVLLTQRVPYGVWASSAYVRLSSVTVSTFGALGVYTAGVRLSSWSAVSYSSVTTWGSHALWLDASTMTTVSYSSFQANSNNFYGVYLQRGSSNTMTGLRVGNSLGGAVYFDATSSNRFTLSTAVAGSFSAALQLQGTSSSNTIESSYFRGANGTAFTINTSADYNQVRQSTISRPGSSALYVGGDYNLIEGVYSPELAGCSGFNLGGDYNEVRTSTFGSCCGNGPALALNGSSNTVSGSYFRNCSYHAIQLGGGNNRITGSTAVASGYSGGPSLYVYGSYNRFEDGLVTDDGGGPGVGFQGASCVGNAVVRSTIASLSYRGVWFDQSSTNSVVGSYIQGTTAAWVSGSTGAHIGGSTLYATGAGASALWMDNRNSMNLTVSSSALRAGAAGWGVNLSSQNRGVLTLSTLTITGARYGVYVATQSAGARVWLTSTTIIVPPSTSFDSYGVYLDGLVTGATVSNNAIVWRQAGSQAGFTAYGLYARSVAGIEFDHNRVSQPGLLTAGSWTGAYLTGASQTRLRHNDVLAVGTGLTDGYLLRLEGSTVTARGNVFVASMTVTGSSASLRADAVSGIDSDYNDWFSSNTANALVWGAVSYPWPWSAAIGKDAGSISAEPQWYDAAAGVEDFHPRSRAGRWSVAAQAFVNDGTDSPAIDAGDPAAPFSREPSSNGGRSNQGSYGDTAEASRSFAGPPSLPQVTAVYLSSATLASEPAAGASKHMVEASTAADFTGVILASETFSAAATALTPQGLLPNTTYFLRAGAL